MGAGSAFPLAGTHQQFGVLTTFVAVKFVERHGERISKSAKTSREASLFCFRAAIGMVILTLVLVEPVCRGEKLIHKTRFL